MTIYTKSVQKEKEKDDGIRICIMRRIKPEFEFDIWMPHLAPSTELLRKYQEQEIDWEEFRKLFTADVLNTQSVYLEIVLDIAKKNTVTLVCWEETAEKCHRLLVTQKLAEFDSSVLIEHK